MRGRTYLIGRMGDFLTETRVRSQRDEYDEVFVHMNGEGIWIEESMATRAVKGLKKGRSCGLEG